jgi:hypothetical protein
MDSCQAGKYSFLLQSPDEIKELVVVALPAPVHGDWITEAVGFHYWLMT